MEQTHSGLVTSLCNNQEYEARDRIGFWLSVLMLCLLPIERILLPFNLKPADFALVLLMLYGLVKAWRTRQRLDFPLLLPLWLILLSSLIATQIGLAYVRSIIAIAQEVYLFAWFIVLTNLLRTLPQSDQDRLMKVWSVIALAEAVTALMGMLRIGPSMFHTVPYREQNIRTRFGRGVGTYANPNATAVYLSVSFFLLLATSWPNWLRAGFGAWLLAGLFSTGSNGALLSTLGSLVILGAVYSIIKDRRATMLWGAVLGMGLGVVAVILFTLALWPSLLSSFGFDTRGQFLLLTLGRFSNSMAERLGLIKWAWRTYSLHLWGTGPDSFASLGASLHNDYTAFLFERGPIGIVGWLWMVGATLLAPLRAASQLTDRRQRWPVLALGTGFLACTVNAFSHEISHMRQVWVLLVFIFALSYVYSTRPPTRSLVSIESIEKVE